MALEIHVDDGPPVTPKGVVLVGGKNIQSFHKVREALLEVGVVVLKHITKFKHFNIPPESSRAADLDAILVMRGCCSRDMRRRALITAEVLGLPCHHAPTNASSLVEFLYDNELTGFPRGFVNKSVRVEAIVEDGEDITAELHAQASQLLAQEAQREAELQAQREAEELELLRLEYEAREQEEQAQNLESEPDVDEPEEEPVLTDTSERLTDTSRPVDSGIVWRVYMAGSKPRLTRMGRRSPPCSPVTIGEDLTFTSMTEAAKYLGDEHTGRVSRAIHTRERVEGMTIRLATLQEVLERIPGVFHDTTKDREVLARRRTTRSQEAPEPEPARPTPMGQPDAEAFLKAAQRVRELKAWLEALGDEGDLGLVAGDELIVLEGSDELVGLTRMRIEDLIEQEIRSVYGS